MLALDFQGVGGVIVICHMYHCEKSLLLQRVALVRHVHLRIECDDAAPIN
jgi:hypothetical protein